MTDRAILDLAKRAARAALAYNPRRRRDFADVVADACLLILEDPEIWTRAPLDRVAELRRRLDRQIKKETRRELKRIDVPSSSLAAITPEDPEPAPEPISTAILARYNDRDRQLVEALLSGARQVDVAAVFGISQARVSQILKRFKKHYKEEKQKWESA